MKKLDLFLPLLVVLLTLFGLLMIYDASSFIAFKEIGDKYHYVRDQSIWVVLGFILMGIFSFVDYHKLYNLSLPIFILTLVFLLLVFIPGIGVSLLGAHRWLNFRFFLFQPAEFIKLALAIYLSAWFSSKERGRLFAFCLLMGFILLLVMLEPDMGTSIIILLEAVGVYFLSGGSVLALSFLAPVIGILGFLLIKVAPYRAARLSAFFNQGGSLENSSYHVKQILIALGMGGLTGVGLGNSLQKYAYLPENTTDSIFAIIAEELGFIGSVILIFLFVLVVWRGFYIAIRAKDNFGKLLAGGIIIFLAAQIIINLGAQTALLPLTGVPLPFISYGGSSLLVDLSAVGILLNVSKQGSNV